MATKGTRAPPARKGNVSDYQYPVPPLPVDANAVPRQDWENVMGWIAACVLFILLLPLNAMLFIDILEAKHDVKVQMEKLEKLRREVERNKRDTNTFADNPIFDRVRRPLSLSMPRPEKLGNP